MKIKLLINFLIVFIASGFIFTKAAYADTLSGHVYDYSGNAVQGQVVTLKNTSGTTVATSTTSSSGSYSLTATGGTYRLDIKGTNNSLSLEVPQNYTLTNYSYSFSGTATYDITIPLKKVIMHTQDASSNPISGVRIGGQDTGFAGMANDNLTVSGVTGFTAIDSYSTSTGPTTDSSGNATLYLISNNSPYDYTFAANPPSGSGYSVTTLNNLTVTSDSTQNITFQTPVTLSGYVYDKSSNGVSGQTITLSNALGMTAATQNTNSSGYYSLTVQPNTYKLVVSKSNNSLSVNLPQNYNLYTTNYTISTNTTLNVTVPVNNVTVNVKDFYGNPVSGVVVKASGCCFGGTINDSLTIGGSTTVTGIDSYTSNTGPTTDSSGNATLWLFPTVDPYQYNFTLVAPSGTVYQNTTVSNVSFTGDTTLNYTINQPKVTLSGHVYDPLSNAVSNQQVIIKSATSGATLASNTTDSSGNFSLQAPQNINYRLDVIGTNNSSSVNLPPSYVLSDYSYSLTGNTTLNMTIPAKSVSVHLQDATGAAVNGATLLASDQSYGGVVNDNLTLGTGVTGVTGANSYSVSDNLQTNSSGNATMWLLPTNSAYDYTFIANPPSGGSYLITVKPNITFSSNTSVTMAMQPTSTLSGHVYDYSGNPVDNQTVNLQTSGGIQIATTTTNSLGAYSMQAQQGTYRLDVQASGNSISLQVPENYILTNYSFLLSSSTVSMDVNLPVKKISVHVKDSSNNPVSGVKVSASDPSFAGVVNDNLTIATGITGVTGVDSYNASSGPATDSSGNASLYLFPTNGSYTYDLIATPPGGSGYSTTTLNGVTFSSDQSETITLN